MSNLATTRTPAADRTQALRFTAFLVFLVLLILTLYTFAHEGGHALVGVLFGGKINGFSINFFDLSAHVGFAEPAARPFSLPQRALISVAGVSLPVLLCLAFFLLSPKQSSPILNWFRLVLFMGTANSLLAWIVIPLLALSGQVVSDDSYSFLNYTQFPPLLVSAAALAVYLACWFVFLRRIGGPRAALAALRDRALDFDQPGTQKTIRGLAALAVLTAGLAVGLSLVFPERGFQPPAGYQKVSEFGLSEGRLQNVAIYTFRLDSPASASLFIGLDQVKGGPVKLRLVGPGGYENVFLDMQDPKTDIGQASVHPQAIPLEKGDYALLATFQPSQGQVRVYIRIE